MTSCRLFWCLDAVIANLVENLVIIALHHGVLDVLAQFLDVALHELTHFEPTEFVDIEN